MKQKRLLIFIVCYLAYTSIYIARLNLSMASPGLIEAGIMDKTQIGLLGSIFSVVYACGRLINGGIGDRCAPWVMIAAGLALCGAGNLAVSLFPPFFAMVLLWGLNAFAQSMLWSSVLRVLSAVYPPDAVKKKTSYMVTSVAFGNIMGIVVGTLLIDRLGIRYAFLVPGFLTLFFCLAAAWVLHGVKPELPEDGKPRPIFAVLADRDVRRTVLPAMFHGVMKDNISLWMTVYFVDRFVIDLNRSAYFILFIPAVGFLGRMLYPAVYRLTGYREHAVSAAGFVLCTVCALPLAFDTSSPAAAVICLSLIYAAVSLINTTLLSIFPMQYRREGNVSSVSGIMDFSTYLGAGIGSAVYGAVIERAGYVPMFVSWAVLAAVSVLLTLPLAGRRGAQGGT